MMGTKARLFTPLPSMTLDELVPADHFYRHLDRVLDLSFVRDLVRDCYATGTGRPSVDPVVFFRLQLVMCFESIRSERQLMRVAADRLSVRWYLGFNLDEPLPDHSSLTRIRSRYGVEVFPRFFDAILDQCRKAGLVWGQELDFDSTQVQANAALSSLTPRFAVEAQEARNEARQAVEAHLDALFAESETDVAVAPTTTPAPTTPTTAPMRAGAPTQPEEPNPLPVVLPVVLPGALREQLASATAARHD